MMTELYVQLMDEDDFQQWEQAQNHEDMLFEQIVMGENFHGAARKKAFKQFLGERERTEYLNKSLQQANPTFRLFKKNYAELASIKESNEQAAMKWENRFLAEVGLPERTVYMSPKAVLKKPLSEPMSVHQKIDYVKSFHRIEKADLGFKIKP